MKKKSILALGIAALAIVSGYGGMKIFQSRCTNANSLMAMNVEALSNTEASSKRFKCYTSFVYEAGSAVVDCTTCTLFHNHSDALLNFHDYCVR